LKFISAYQVLLQNEIFGTQIDRLYDEYHMNSSYSNVNSNHHHARETTNPNGTNNTTINTGINTQSGSTTTVNGQIYKTSISGINVKYNF
jgi:hypothetical protein